MSQTSETLETIEKLTIALQLLHEAKISHVNVTAFIPLNIESTLPDYRNALQQLTEQAVLRDAYELQDACFLLEELLGELSDDGFTMVSGTLFAAFNEWSIADSATEEAEQEEPAQLIPDLLHPESIPDTHISELQQIGDSEKLLVEEALTRTLSDEATLNNPAPDDTVLQEALAVTTGINPYLAHITHIEALAQQISDEGCAGLSDISFILVEALRELLPGTSKSDLPALLDNWSQLVGDYQRNATNAINDIMMILRHPELNLPFEDSDFAMFETLLAEDMANALAKELPSVKENFSALDLSALDALLAKDITTTPDSISAITVPNKNSLVEENELIFDLSALNEEESFTDHSVGTTQDVPVLTPTHTPLDESSLIVDDEVTELSAEAKELVELLDTEADLLSYRFLTVSFDESTTSRTEHLQQASEELARMTNAAKMIGFDGLALVCEQVNANVALFAQDISRFTEKQRNLLADWVVQVKAYLLVFNKKGAGKQLLAHITQADWATPLPVETADILLAKMQVQGFGKEPSEESKREKTATDADVSLALPDDVNKELLDLLLQELPTYTQQFSEAIQHLQSGNGTSKDIDIAQRIAHTIKGSANTVGIKGIAFLTHQIEDILMACAKAHKQPIGLLMNVLINASDCLEAMCESLLGMGDAPRDAREILQDVLNWANKIDKQGIQVIEQYADAPASTDTKQHVSAETVAERRETIALQPESAKDAPAEKVESAQAAIVRVPTEQIENLFRLSSESIILNGQVSERQRRMKAQLQTMETQFALLQQLGAELEQLIDLKDLSGRSLVNTGENFDALEMDQYNELHTASRRMVEAAVDARSIGDDMRKELEYMNEILEYQQRLVIDTQESVMQTRFVPVGSIGLRLQRGLRQTCRLTGKQGELTLTGENLLIDGDTLNALVEPLMHLLRNAIDHGLEIEQERIAMGKPPVGQVTIDFDREGNSILIRCRDDGRGLNFAAIRQIAEQRGDIKVGDHVTEDELKRFILRPNFSTTTKLTQTSGRGVGMDVVNFQVLSLGGSLSLHSKQNEGLTVELRVPLPLSRSHALLAYAGSYKVAISSKGVTQVLYSSVDDITIIGNEQVLVIGDDMYPVVKLEDLLHVDEPRKEQHTHSAVLLVQNEDKMTAVLVSAITDSREVVIKNLGYYMKKIHGFVGATILGDGSVTPVLDVPELLRTPLRSTSYAHTSKIEETDFNSRLTKVLLVDDSLSQRRALEQILTDAGFGVQTARDGLEAADWLAHNRPELVITDLEMPRMNGLELASHIRTHANIKDLPIIMITSRSTQKHRQMAEDAGIDYYLVKPVKDDDLLTKIQTLINKQFVTAEV